MPNCGLRHKAHGYCNRHYRRLLSNGDPSDGALQRRQGGEGWYINGYHYITHNGERRPAHVVIVEEAIGRRLKGDELVHHRNGVKDDNAPTNLVLCPDQAYHLLLHQRMRALNACGNANWRRCAFCKQYDDVSNLTVRSTGYHHAQCAAAYETARYQRLFAKGKRHVK